MELANHLEAIAYYEDLYKIERHEYRSSAYRVSANLFRQLTYEVLTSQEARTYKGVGPKISKRVEQFSKTGTSTKLEKLRARDPKRNAVIKQLTRVRGLSIVAANDLYDLGVTSLDDLLVKFKLLGRRADVVCLENVDRFSLVIPREEIHSFEAAVRASLPRDIRVLAVGAYRRAEDAREIDLLFTHLSEKQVLMRDVLEMKGILLLITEGLELTSSTFRGVTYTKRLVNMRMFPEECYPQALLHMTGPGRFRTDMRLRANQMGLYLNEYYLVDQGTKDKTTSERDLFHALDSDYVLPVHRRYTERQ